MLRSSLLYLSRQQRIFDFVKNVGFARQIASRFVAGETIASACDAVVDLNKKGITASLDLLGEAVTNEAEAREIAEKRSFRRKNRSVKSKPHVTLENLAEHVAADLIAQAEHDADASAWLVTADEVADPQKLGIKLWVNGTLKQDFNTDDMAHKIARCIEWVSHCHTLEPGDILATGTNHRGLSSFQDGDTVELETEGLGKLSFKVQDDLKRSWARDTRLERAEKGLSATAPQLTGKYAQPQ
jgi:hypothetical protein